MAKDLHVVMVPWLAFGHMIPFLQLSTALAKAGIRISYISTPKNIQRLPKPPASLAHLFSFVQLPLPPVNDLPDGAEATVDLPFDKIQYLKIAYDHLQKPFRQFISEELPDWMIVDTPNSWTASIAGEYGVPLLFFSVFSPVLWSFLGPQEYLAGKGQRRVWSTPESLTSPPEWFPHQSSVAVRGYDALGFHTGAFGMNASGKTDGERLAMVLDACQAVAIRGCPEFDGEYMDLLRKHYQKPVIPVGVLPPEQPEENREADGSWGKIFEWLDRQNLRSVVFVGFGSEYKLTREEVYEIAYGLELSQLPFLWALRKPSWAVDDLDALPLGFEERTSSRGMVSLGWAPQMKILAHQSIGGSLFHSGWGSIIETLQYGHVLVLLPFIVDQGLNARFLVEKGVAFEVERRDDGSFDRNHIAKALRLALVEEEGEKVRVRAREVSEIFGDRKLHDAYINGFVEYLRNGVRNQ